MMNANLKIMLIEDDESIAQSVKLGIESWGYEVVLAKDFNNIIEEFKQISPSLVLMDIMLPAYNGFYWCQELRKFSKVPVIFISSRSDDFDLIQGMQIGGDDYITKPVSTEVIRAKVQAVLRRSYEFGESSNTAEYGELILDIGKAELQRAEVVKDNGLATSTGKADSEESGGALLPDKTALTRTELYIMQELIKAKGEVVTRTKLIEVCWQGEDFIDDNTLAVNISRLRNKLSKLGLGDMLRTKRGIGYFLKLEK